MQVIFDCTFRSLYISLVYWDTSDDRLNIAYFCRLLRRFFALQCPLSNLNLNLRVSQSTFSSVMTQLFQNLRTSVVWYQEYEEVIINCCSIHQSSCTDLSVLHNAEILLELRVDSRDSAVDVLVLEYCKSLGKFLSCLAIFCSAFNTWEFLIHELSDLSRLTFDPGLPLRLLRVLLVVKALAFMRSPCQSAPYSSR